MNNAPFVPARWDWPSAIGQIILRWGYLEYLVTTYLKDRLPDVEYATMKNQPLYHRVQRITRYLDDEGYPQNERDIFADLCARLEPVRELATTSPTDISIVFSMTIRQKSGLRS